jgi:hypothetical protein
LAFLFIFWLMRNVIPGSPGRLESGTDGVGAILLVFFYEKPRARLRQAGLRGWPELQGLNDQYLLDGVALLVPSPKQLGAAESAA